MWEATLIESKGSGRRWRQLWSIPAAAALHTTLIFVALVASYWNVEAVEAPPQTLRYMEPIQVTLTPPPALGGGEHKTNRVPKMSTPPVTQPTEVPPLSKEPDIAVDSFGPSENVDSSPGSDVPLGPGVPSGIAGGIGSTPLSNGIGVEDAEPAVYITPNVTPPVLLRRVEPEYPRVAAHARIDGMVILEAVITKNGDVEDVRTLRSDHPALEKAAKEAVLEWKYKPALVNGRPVKVYFTVTCRFHFR